MLVAQAQAQFEWWTGRTARRSRDARRGGRTAGHAQRRNRRGEKVKLTTFEEFVDLAKRATFVPVCKELVADLLTPVSAFLKVAEHSDYAFLLESVEGGEHVGRYSFLGKDPFLILRGREGQTVIEKAGVTTNGDKPFVDTLRELMNSFQSPFVPGLPRFTGGAVGYLGYDTAAWFEPTAARAGDAPLDRDDAGLHAVRHGAGLRSRPASHPADRQRAHLRRRRSEVALSVCLREDRVPRARARARAVAEAADRRRRASTSSRTCRSRRTSRSSSARRNTSPPATSTRSCCRSVSKPRSASMRSPSIARCATSIRRRTCSSSGWAIARSSDRRPRCWCASKAVTPSRIRSPARGRAASRKKKTCGSAKS